MDGGGGLVVSDASTGLTVDVRVRMAGDAPGRGVPRAGHGGLSQLQPDAVDAAGLHSAGGAVVGRTDHSRAEALWGRETMAGLAAGSLASGNRVDADVGYGLPVGSRFVGTLRVGFATSEYGRDYRLGYGLGVLGGAGLNFELGSGGPRAAAGDRRRGGGGGCEVSGVLRGADRERENAGGVTGPPPVGRGPRQSTSRPASERPRLGLPPSTSCHTFRATGITAYPLERGNPRARPADRRARLAQGVGSTLRRSNGRTRDASFLTEEPRVFGSRLSGVFTIRGGSLCVAGESGGNPSASAYGSLRNPLAGLKAARARGRKGGGPRRGGRRLTGRGLQRRVVLCIARKRSGLGNTPETSPVVASVEGGARLRSEADPLHGKSLLPAVKLRSR